MPSCTLPEFERILAALTLDREQVPVDNAFFRQKSAVTSLKSV